MDSDPKVCQLQLPPKEFWGDGIEDPQTLPQLEISHSSDTCYSIVEVVETK